MGMWSKKYKTAIIMICCLLAIGGVIAAAVFGRNRAVDNVASPTVSEPEQSNNENAAPATNEKEPAEKIYTLMDLGSRGCVPCDNLQPVLATLRTKYDGKINILFYDVNRTTEGAKLAQQYKVQYIPTLVFLDKSGKEVKRIVGFQTQEELETSFKDLEWIQ